MYDQLVQHGTQVGIIYRPVVRLIDGVRYTGRLYIQLHGEEEQLVTNHYPPPGAAPLVAQENMDILFEIRVVNADTGQETGDFYKLLGPEPVTPDTTTATVIWNFTDNWERAGGTVEFQLIDAALIAAGEAVAQAASDANNYDALVNRQYDNKILTLQQLGLKYVIDGPGNALTIEDITEDRAPQWDLLVAQYQQPHGLPKLYGYWIYRVGRNVCWKLKARWPDPSDFHVDLELWNYNGAAGGSPEDYELFNFFAVDKSQMTVKIGSAYGSYVGLSAEKLHCREKSLENATIFYGRFPKLNLFRLRTPVY